MKAVFQITLFVCCLSVPCFGSEETVFTDKEGIFLNFKYAMIRMAKAKKLIPAKELHKHLLRKETNLTLPVIKQNNLSTTDLYKSIRESVLITGKLFKKGKNPNWHLLTASAFCLSESGIIVTNYHVVAQQDAKYLAVMTHDKKVFGVKEILVTDRVNDIAILQLDGSGFKPIPLNVNSEVGDQVFVISHPDRYYYLLTQGIISGYYLQQSIFRKKSQMLAITVPYGLGSSGAPVLDKTGNVIGMVSRTHAVRTKLRSGNNYTQMVIGNCVPAKYIIDCFKKK